MKYNYILKNTNEIKQQFQDWCQQRYENDDYNTWFWEYIKDHCENIWVVLLNDTIVQFFTTQRLYDATVFYPQVNQDYMQESIELLVDRFGKDIFVYGEYLDLNKVKLSPMNQQSTICDNGEPYYYPQLMYYYSSSSANVNYFRDKLESMYFNVPNWKNKVRVVNMSAKELNASLLNKPWPGATYWQSFGMEHIIGFHYLNPSRDDNAHMRYVVAVADDKPIGVIAWADCTAYEYYAVNYIDVSIPYRRNGIAKMMIEHLASIIPGNKPVVLSDESEYGKHCNIHAVFKRYNWPNHCFTDTEFAEYSRENH